MWATYFAIQSVNEKRKAAGLFEHNWYCMHYIICSALLKKQQKNLKTCIKACNFLNLKHTDALHARTTT